MPISPRELSYLYSEPAKHLSGLNLVSRCKNKCLPIIPRWIFPLNVSPKVLNSLLLFVINLIGSQILRRFILSRKLWDAVPGLSFAPKIKKPPEPGFILKAPDLTGDFYFKSLTVGPKCWSYVVSWMWHSNWALFRTLAPIVHRFCHHATIINYLDQLPRWLVASHCVLFVCSLV